MNSAVIDTNVLIDCFRQGQGVAEKVSEYDRILVCPAVIGEFNAGIDAETKKGRKAKKRLDEFLDDPAVVEYLGVQQYYKNALKVDEFEDLFEKSNDEMKDVVSKLSKGQRKSVAYLARKQIADGTIDSRQKIATLENLLGVDLVEK